MNGAVEELPGDEGERRPLCGRVAEGAVPRNARRIDLLDDKRLAAQFLGLERRTSRAGKDSIDHGPSGHDDLANAAAGAAGLLAAESSYWRDNMAWVGDCSRLYDQQPYFQRLGGLPWLR